MPYDEKTTTTTYPDICRKHSFEPGVQVLVFSFFFLFFFLFFFFGGGGGTLSVNCYFEII